MRTVYNLSPRDSSCQLQDSGGDSVTIRQKYSSIYTVYSEGALRNPYSVGIFTCEKPTGHRTRRAVLVIIDEKEFVTLGAQLKVVNCSLKSNFVCVCVCSPWHRPPNCYSLASNVSPSVFELRLFLFCLGERK